MSTSIIPIADRVLIKQIKVKDSPGIVLPEAAKKKPHIGTVVAVGPGRVFESGDKQGQFFPVSVSVGDKVYYASYSGTEIEADGEKYIVLGESDILAIEKGK